MQIESVADSLEQFAAYQAKAQPGAHLDALWLNCSAIPIISACAHEIARRYPEMADGLLIDAVNAEGVSHLVPHGYLGRSACLASATWQLATGRYGAEHVVEIIRHLREIALDKLQYVDSVHRDDIAKERQALMPLAQTGRVAQKQRSEAGFSSGNERRAARQPVWEEWQARANELHEGNKARSKSDICAQVGQEFSVTREAVGKRVKIPGTERPRSKK